MDCFVSFSGAWFLVGRSRICFCSSSCAPGRGGRPSEGGVGLGFGWVEAEFFGAGGGGGTSDIDAFFFFNPILSKKLTFSPLLCRADQKEYLKVS